MATTFHSLQALKSNMNVDIIDAEIHNQVCHFRA